jgi:hypothetical protein
MSKEEPGGSKSAQVSGVAGQPVSSTAGISRRREEPAPKCARGSENGLQRPTGRRAKDELARGPLPRQCLPPVGPTGGTEPLKRGAPPSGQVTTPAIESLGPFSLVITPIRRTSNLPATLFAKGPSPIKIISMSLVTH